MATFDDVPGLSAVHIRLMTPSCTQPQFSLPGIRDPQRDYPFENLSVQCGTTPSNFNTSIQRPLARQRVMLSRRVIAYYGLIRDSESLPATYEFVAESAAPKEIGLRWESRGSPIYSAGLDSCATSLTPVAPKSIEIRCRNPVSVSKSGVSSSFSLKSGVSSSFSLKSGVSSSFSLKSGVSSSFSLKSGVSSSH